MDSTTRLKRHALLWNAGSSSVRQLSLSSLIFAAVILFNVIEPNAKVSISEKELEQQKSDLKLDETELERLKANHEELVADLDEVKEDLDKTEAFLERLNDIEQIINRVPWNSHNQELQSLFRSGEDFAHQETANDTVRRVAKQIRDEVVEPFRSAADEIDVTGDLAAYPRKIEDAINSWRDGLINKPWYVRIDLKNETFRNVTSLVGDLQDQAIARVKAGLTAERQKRVDILERQSDLAGQIESIETKKTAKEKAIETAMQGIDAKRQEVDKALKASLPEWAKTLVNVEAIVRFYPWILIVVAFLLVGRALNAAEHYNKMANEEGWSFDERSDPLLSSIWTLTWRGKFGTSVTLSCYLALLLCLWYLISKSLVLAPTQTVPLWLPYGFMFLAVITVVLAPFRRLSNGA